MTKNTMARVIVTALYNRPQLVRADDREVVRRARNGRVKTMTHEYLMALAAIRSGHHAEMLEEIL